MSAAGPSAEGGSIAGGANVPRAKRPLRVALIGWARLSNQAREGSGYNLNASELARGLALRGHSVSYLASGMNYRARWLGFGSSRVPRVVDREIWCGVRCFDLMNAPNLAPAAMNFRNMAEESCSPATTRAVLEWLRDVRAGVVHIHSLEGYGLDLIGEIEAAGVPVVVTPHNYWYVCPQVDLLHREREVCVDFDGGRRCVGCLPGKDVARLRKQRAIGQSLEAWLGPYPADVVRKAVYGASGLTRAILRGKLHRRWSPPMLHPDVPADVRLWAGFDELDRTGSEHAQGAAVDGDGQRSPSVHFGTSNGHARSHEQALPLMPNAIDLNERVLRHAEQGTRVQLPVLNSYGERRSAGVAALASASLVTPPSDFVRRVYVSMGVPEGKTRCVRLGQPHFDAIHRRARRSPFYRSRPWDPATSTRPLRFAFFGTTRPNKGVSVLARAIPLVEPSLRRRAQFIIRAQGHDAELRRSLAAYAEVSVWGGYDLLQLMSAGGEYDVGVLSHIWLENSPLVLLENLHAGKFVITARLGGPPEWIVAADERPGTLGNGLMFAGGDARGLADRIEQCIRGDVTIPSAAEIHDITPNLRSFPEHVLQVEALYDEVIARDRGKPGRVVVRSNAVAAALEAR